jgi:hypothetical protein
MVKYRFEAAVLVGSEVKLPIGTKIRSSLQVGCTSLPARDYLKSESANDGAWFA